MEKNMKYGIMEFREQVNGFFNRTVSRKELGEWAQRAYYDLLKGAYIEKEKIVLYPFLKTVSQFHIKEDDIRDVYPCTERDVKNVQNILLGKECCAFQVEMAIPVKVRTMFYENVYFNQEKFEMFKKLRNEMHIYDASKANRDAISYMRSFLYEKNKNETVLDLLQENIVKLYKVLYDTQYLKVGINTQMKLYVQNSMNNLIYEKLQNYLDCYIGNRSFYVLVSYISGIPDLSLLI